MNHVLFKGECFAVCLEPRSAKHKHEIANEHIEVKILVEDDENWHAKVVFSSHWLDELIEKLSAARDFCHTQKPDNCGPNGEQYGWIFKKS